MCTPPPATAGGLSGKSGPGPALSGRSVSAYHWAWACPLGIVGWHRQSYTRSGPFVSYLDNRIISVILDLLRLVLFPFVGRLQKTDVNHEDAKTAKKTHLAFAFACLTAHPAVHTQRVPTASEGDGSR